jgi:hypothetical protein
MIIYTLYTSIVITQPVTGHYCHVTRCIVSMTVIFVCVSSRVWHITSLHHARPASKHPTIHHTCRQTGTT